MEMVKKKSCDLMETAVSGLLNGIPIHGYSAVNMDSISVITDLVGGVEITVPDASLEKVNPNFGKVLLLLLQEKMQNSLCVIGIRAKAEVRWFVRNGKKPT